MSQEHWSSPNGCHPDCPACAHEGEEECEFDFIEDGEWHCNVHDLVMMQKAEPANCTIRQEHMDKEQAPIERIEATPQQIQAARDYYQTDDVEIDDGALASPAPEYGGAWVAAWVWVGDEEVGGES